MPTDNRNLRQNTPASQAKNLAGPDFEPGADLFTDPDQHDPDRYFDRIQEEE